MMENKKPKKTLVMILSILVSALFIGTSVSTVVAQRDELESIGPFEEDCIFCADTLEVENEELFLEEYDKLSDEEIEAYGSIILMIGEYSTEIQEIESLNDIQRVIVDNYVIEELNKLELSAEKANDKSFYRKVINLIENKADTQKSISMERPLAMPRQSAEISSPVQSGSSPTQNVECTEDAYNNFLNNLANSVGGAITDFGGKVKDWVNEDEETKNTKKILIASVAATVGIVVGMAMKDVLILWNGLSAAQKALLASNGITLACILDLLGNPIKNLTFDLFCKFIWDDDCDEDPDEKQPTVFSSKSSSINLKNNLVNANTNAQDNSLQTSAVSQTSAAQSATTQATTVQASTQAVSASTAAQSVTTQAATVQASTQAVSASTAAQSVTTQAATLQAAAVSTSASNVAAASLSH